MLRISSVEGNRQWLDGGAMFGNAPRVMWEKWCVPDERGRIELATRGFLIEDRAGRRILVEAGVGAFFSPRLRERFGVSEPEHRLLESLDELGVASGDIDAIVLSHLHFDHAGGLLSAYREGEAPSLVFPRAEFFVSKGAWERALSPHSRDKASFIVELPSLLRATGRLRFVEEDASPSPELSFSTSSGHTPSMLLPIVRGEKAEVFFGADLVPGVPWVHLPVTMGYDRAPELLIDEKRELFERLVGGYVLFEHDVRASAGRLAKKEDGRFFVSESFEKLVRWDIDAESEPPRPLGDPGI